MKKLKKIIRAFTVLWIIIIFSFSIQPAYISSTSSGKILVKLNLIEEEQIHSVGDWNVLRLQIIIRKIAHFMEYFILGVLMFLSFSGKRLLLLNNLIYPWLLCTAVGAADETIQCFIPGRGPGIGDVVLDSASSLTGILVTACLMLITRKYFVHYTYFKSIYRGD